MSLKIIKAGLLDTIRDLGRYGYQHLGINPSGVMDGFAMQVINALLCNDKNEAVIEMHFPAAGFLFESDAMIAIGGADFSPMVNDKPIPLWQPVLVKKDSRLQFKELKSGVRAYLAVKGGFQIKQWLKSSSTNKVAEAGGFNGRPLRKQDMIAFKKENNYTARLKKSNAVILSWKAAIQQYSFAGNSIYVLPGNEWDWLDEDSKKNFLSRPFEITAASDRMGYRLNSSKLYSSKKEELVSSAVSFGTIQLLPGGQLIILMADHQTSGGYPRIAHVIAAHHSKLSQMKASEAIDFKMIDIRAAEDLLTKQQQYLQQLEIACKFRMKEFLE